MVETPMADNKTIIETAGDLAKQTITVLPPSFLLLVVLNLCFLGMVLWFIEHEMSVRMTLMMRVIEMAKDSCPTGYICTPK
jgi:hypothetical protein